MLAVRAFVLPLILATVALTGCAGIKEPERSGFLTDYSRLEEIDDDFLFYSAGKTHEYDQFIVEPVQLLFSPEETDSPFTREELTELQAFFNEQLVERITEDDGYPVVEEPGPGVARMRVGITDVKKTIGALNITIWTKVTGAGIGGASAEYELVDSVTGEQLAAAVRWGGGSRLLMAGITQMGDAKIAIKRWAKDFRERLDEVHGRAPQ